MYMSCTHMHELTDRLQASRTDTQTDTLSHSLSTGIGNLARYFLLCSALFCSVLLFVWCLLSHNCNASSWLVGHGLGSEVTE